MRKGGGGKVEVEVEVKKRRGKRMRRGDGRYLDAPAVRGGGRQRERARLGGHLESGHVVARLRVHEAHLRQVEEQRAVRLPVAHVARAPAELEHVGRVWHAPRVRGEGWVARVASLLHRVVEPHAVEAVEQVAVRRDVFHAPAVGGERGERDCANRRIDAEVRLREHLRAPNPARLVAKEDAGRRVQQREAARLPVVDVARLEGRG